MDIRTTRRARLLSVVKSFPTVAAFAKEYKLDATYIRQLLGGHREIGEKAARKLEQAMDKEPGWLDESHALPLPAGLDKDEVAWLKIWREFETKEEKKAALAAMRVFKASYAGPEPNSQEQGGRGEKISGSKT